MLWEILLKDAVVGRMKGDPRRVVGSEVILKSERIGGVVEEIGDDAS